MDNGKQIIYWIAGAAGTMLIYSAYKHKSPLSELQSFFAGNSAAQAAPATTTTATTTADVTAGPPTNDNSIGNGQAGDYAGPYTVNGQYVYDANGNPVSEVPSVYSNSPGTYIPSKTGQ